MNKISFLIVCLCAGLTFVCQAQGYDDACAIGIDVNGDGMTDVSDLTDLIDLLLACQDACGTNDAGDVTALIDALLNAETDVTLNGSRPTRPFDPPIGAGPVKN